MKFDEYWVFQILTKCLAFKSSLKFYRHKDPPYFLLSRILGWCRNLGFLEFFKFFDFSRFLWHDRGFYYLFLLCYLFISLFIMSTQYQIAMFDGTGDYILWKVRQKHSWFNKRCMIWKSLLCQQEKGFCSNIIEPLW